MRQHYWFSFSKISGHLLKRSSKTFAHAFSPSIHFVGSLANSSSEKVNLFVLFFLSNFNLNFSVIPPPPPSPLRCLISLPVITRDQVDGILSSLNNKMAIGSDGIFLVLWGCVHLSRHLSPFISTLYFGILILFFSTESVHASILSQ